MVGRRVAPQYIISFDEYRSAGAMMVENLGVTNCRYKAGRVRRRRGASHDAEAALVGANSCVEMQHERSARVRSLQSRHGPRSTKLALLLLLMRRWGEANV
jgi:hypothetical protein